MGWLAGEMLLVTAHAKAPRMVVRVMVGVRTGSADNRVPPTPPTPPISVFCCWTGRTGVADGGQLMGVAVRLRLLVCVPP